MRTDFQVRQSHPSFHLDKINQCVWLREEQILLSPKAFAVLLYLSERPGTLVTKQELLDSVWPDVFVTEGVLKRAVLEIRKALSDSAGEPRFIQTRHRVGYRFLVQSGCEDKVSPSEPPERPARQLPNVLHVVLESGFESWRHRSVYVTPRRRLARSHQAGAGY